MQKKIIALAVAALASSAAFAQSNVTVYGVADLGQAWVQASGTNSAHQSVSRLDSNSSYIGFKGVEDLGNGLKAVFQFETGVNADQSVANEFGAGRDTYVGLAGGFGTVAMGTLTPPSRAYGAKVDLLPGAAGFGTTASVTGTILGTKTGADDRAQNAVAYISPSFAGFTAIAAFVNGEVRNNAGVNSHQYQVAGQYDNGPLFVGLAYHRTIDLAATGTFTAGAANVANVNTDNATVSRLAAVYTFPSNTKLTALFDRTVLDVANDGASARRNAYSLGVAQGFGKNTVGFQYGHANKTKVGDDSVASSAASIYTLVYSYDLSKRTMIQARYSRLANQDTVNNQFYNNAVAQGITTGGGTDYTGAMVGVRHTF